MSKIVQVLCDSGEVRLVPDYFMRSPACMTLNDVLKSAGYMLDGACLVNVLVVKTNDGKFYAGEFSFDFRELPEVEARKLAEGYGDPEVDEDEEVPDFGGYHACPCRDCSETAIGGELVDGEEDKSKPALCHACEKAGCEACDCENCDRGCPHGECQAPGAYGGNEEED